MERWERERERERESEKDERERRRRRRRRRRGGGKKGLNSTINSVDSKQYMRLTYCYTGLTGHRLTGTLVYLAHCICSI